VGAGKRERERVIDGCMLSVLSMGQLSKPQSKFPSMLLFADGYLKPIVPTAPERIQ
jgi:hypothetical protein